MADVKSATSIAEFHVLPRPEPQQVPSLFALCCDAFESCEITVYNVLGLLDLAALYRIESLERRSWAFITSTWRGMQYFHSEEDLQHALGADRYEQLQREQAIAQVEVCQVTRVGEVLQKPQAPAVAYAPIEDGSGQVRWPYEALRTSVAWPSGVGAADREQWLSHAEFVQVLGYTREAFAKLPAWKRREVKLKVDLF